MPRRLGQHFLARTSVLQRIAAAAVQPEGSVVVEIGPGKGALTQYLLPLASRVEAIELDQVPVHYLQEKFRGEERLRLHHGDVLQTDLSAWGSVCVAGNLPYYITSPILEKVLAMRTSLLRGVFLVQKEVALRITAQPGTRLYGYLSVLCQSAASTKLLFSVDPGAFRPPPAVDSAVVELVPHATTQPGAREFLRFAALCFTHKRKTLRNNLAGTYPAIEAQPEAGLRAEQLTVEQMRSLWSRLH